ncbi:S16 family serine protease [Streptomyces sp. CC228A]|uniref:S16 family serine protease n=1 Tax=Streptomyces sp. CC228A TaxID=2898186 RepID=UPI001F251ABB|nr:S16 family serine protease [Streptomyces sp. CC228A]
MFSRLSRLSRPRALALCAVPILALFGVAVLAPLPFTLAQPGTTANVLGADKGRPIITISGAQVHETSGELLMTTILATSPSADVGLADVVEGWFRTDRAVLPRDSVYPAGKTDAEIEKRNLGQMRQSQDSAVLAALDYVGEDPDDVDVRLHLADVGGPSAGLLFSLGVVDKLAAGDLTGGRVVAGTGTITPDGRVGAVGGVSLKTQAAARDGATVFLVPKAECGDAESELPAGMRLIPVTTLTDAVSSLRALDDGGQVPSC